MRVSLLVNQLLWAVAMVGVALASHQGIFVSDLRSPRFSDAPAHVDTFAVQTVNRAAKGDRLKRAPQATPDAATNPGGHHAPGVTEEEATTVADVGLPISALLANADTARSSCADADWPHYPAGCVGGRAVRTVALARSNR